MNHGYWGEALQQAVYLHNRTETPTLMIRTPFEMLFGKIPNDSRVGVFGSTGKCTHP